jgi:hypothetical protein
MLGPSGRIILVFLFVCACGGKKHCGDGGMSIHTDGGTVCIGGPNDDEDGGLDALPQDGGRDGSADAPPSTCGNGICDEKETCAFCPQDCGPCHDASRPPDAPTGFCGDGLCSSTESCLSCPTDCGSCPDAGLSCPGFSDVFSSTTGSTVGGPSNSVPSCSTAASGPERWYRFQATASGSCHASTSNLSTGFDTVLSVRASCGSTTDIACNDDANSSMIGPSTVNWTATAGVNYFLVVDGYNNTSGSFTLSVGCP